MNYKTVKKAGIAALVSVLAACSSGGSSSGGNEVEAVDAKETYGCNVINVYNWGEYVGEDVISNFEEAFNAKVNYDMFDSNENMYTRLMGGSSYDVLVPSDYMIERLLKENMLDLGQETQDNAYVHTKYLAEKHVLNAIETRGLDAKIMRVSNLMSREEDAEFQMNFRTNAFMNTLRAYFTLGSIPLDQLDEQVELSYIDETARAVVLLSGTDRKFTVFHPYNTHTVEMGDIVLCMNSLGIHVDAVSDDIFTDRLNNAMGRENINRYLSPLVDYDVEDDGTRREIPADNRFTTKALYRLGFHWTLTDMGFVKRMLHIMDEYGFFDLT